MTSTTITSMIVRALRNLDSFGLLIVGKPAGNGSPARLTA